ncbi:uncharacterized protein LOC125655933 [Ostrea edulis]|uniref:uncharacterized protein LOC125655933 n=1 Tax=Ostrea edulis TaxID=37623 RepID=UPI0024AF3A55|nr:uncharacterized protein LOC125655933 [Ostrea edulis]XP_048742432.2 uncharacterized protein LOC125655933 [Ostrea edulis]XP_055999384.1 uncharacterized protein LOC125655933 [Ostrea edulis]
MDSLGALNRRYFCQTDGKRWIFIFVLGFVFVLGLAILISSITYLHNYNKDENVPESSVSSQQALKNSAPKAVETKGAFQKPSVGDRCSSNINCPDNAVCDRGTCVCSGTYLASGKVCHNVTNLALGKAVFGSSNQKGTYTNKGWQNVVDGRTRVTDFNLLFHTSYELYPWLTVTLGRLSIVKSITIYNRIDGYGRWLHDVETRVGNSTDWAQMSTCGTFVGPSVTGGVHVTECGKLLYGMFVTVKIVKPNYITDDRNARGGKNCLVLEEVVIAGIVV